MGYLRVVFGMGSDAGLPPGEALELQKVVHRLLRATMPALLAAVRAQSLARLLRALVGPGLASRLGLVPFATPVDHLLTFDRLLSPLPRSRSV